MNITRDQFIARATGLGIDSARAEKKYADLVSSGKIGAPADDGTEQKKNTGPVKSVGKYFGGNIGDAASVASGAWDRTKERADRIYEPTVLGGYFKNPNMKAIAGTPERAGRLAGFIGGTAGEVPGMAMELGVGGLNRHTGGKLGEWMGSAAGAVAEKLPEGVKQKAGEIAGGVGEWWSNLSPAEKANYSSAVDMLDVFDIGGGKKATAKTAGKIAKKAKILGKEVPLARGSGATRAAVSSFPGGRAMKEKYTSGIRDDILSAAGQIRKTDDTFEDVAEASKKAITDELKKTDKGFSELYSMIYKAGNRVENIDTDGWVDELVENANKSIKTEGGTPVKVFKDLGSVPASEKAAAISGAKIKPKYVVSESGTGMTSRGAKAAESYVNSIADVMKQEPGARYTAIRRTKSNLGALAYEGADKYLTASDIDVLRTLYRKTVDLERKMLVDMVYPDAKRKAQILDLFDKTNAFFSETEPIFSYAKKMVGYSKEAGEQGSRTAMQALDAALRPENSENIIKFMGIMPEPSVEHLRNGMAVKLIDGAMIENGKTLSLNSLEKTVNKYGPKHLRKVLGNERMDGVEELIKYMKDTDAPNLKFVDPSNPSGTGAAVARNQYYTKLLTGLGVIGAGAMAPAFGAPDMVTKAGLVAGTGTVLGGTASDYASRLVGSVLFNQPLSNIEKLPGDMLKGAVDYAPRVAPTGMTRGVNRGGNDELDKR